MQPLNKVLDAVKRFTDENPSEIVTCWVKKEWSPVSAKMLYDKNDHGCVRLLDSINWSDDLLTYVTNYFGVEKLLDNVTIDTTVHDIVSKGQNIMLMVDNYYYEPSNGWPSYIRSSWGLS